MIVGLAMALLFSSTAFVDATYKVDVTVPPTVTRGTAATVRVHVQGMGGWQFNTSYPTKLTITAPPGTMIQKAV
jgi:hypothetical protein